MENTQELIFIGYKSFKGKQDTTKTYYVLNFMTSPIVSSNRAYCKNIDIFVDSLTYDSFITDNDLLDSIAVPYVIHGDKVQYMLK